MKKIISGFAAAMLLVTAVGCGSSGGGKKTVEVRPDEEIGESGELTVSSLDELSFDRNKDGIITASEISDIVPDFALYNFGDGFSGLANEKEKASKIYGVKVPVKLGKDSYTAFVTFNENQELVEWYVNYKTWNNPNAKTAVNYYEATNKLIDKVYGDRVRNLEQDKDTDYYISYITTWADGNYTIDNTLSVMAVGKSSSANGTIHYTSNDYQK